jgi:amino acid transporter
MCRLLLVNLERLIHKRIAAGDRLSPRGRQLLHADHPRITFNGARAGLLPPRMAAVTRTKVPVASVLIYTGLMVLVAVIPYATMHGNAISIFSDEAGIGTVPILVVYLLANIALSVYILRTHRSEFRFVKHVLVPLLGSAVLV